MTVNGEVSHWFDTMPPDDRQALPGDREVDVCIVGAGLTGLWTAYYLARADPSLRITVLEAEFAGFGASGRNGGWASGLLPGSRRRWAKRHGRGAVLDMQHAMNAAVDEVITVADRESIDANIVKGGTLRVARTPAQAHRLRQAVAADHEWGVPEVQLLGQKEAQARLRVAGTSAAMWTPHCARLHPAALVRGLATTVEQLGVRIHERSPVTQIEPGRAVTRTGTVQAPTVLRAIEGFTPGLPGHRRTWLAMNSSMIATAPLPEQFWTDVGWQGRETLGDTSHAHMYAQRTTDDRIAIGGRGVPYRFGSRTDNRGRTHDRTITSLERILISMFPQVADAGIDRAWCGVLAVPRDWCASVGVDAATGLGWAGGYVGHGVTSTNLAGRTLCDLVLHRDTPLTRLPWVDHRARAWEPEPLRWIGVRSLYLAYRLADQHEATGLSRTSPLASLANLLARPE